MPWRCPRCGRSFGRREQWHSCTPSPDLDDWLATRPLEVRGIVDAVRAHVEALGDDIHLEPTKDALMIKRARTFAEVKPRRDRADLAFILSRRIEDPRVVRTLDLTRRRTAHVLTVSDAADVDQQVREWLTEAYQASPV